MSDIKASRWFSHRLYTEKTNKTFPIKDQADILELITHLRRQIVKSHDVIKDRAGCLRITSYPDMAGEFIEESSMMVYRVNDLCRVLAKIAAHRDLLIQENKQLAKGIDYLKKVHNVKDSTKLRNIVNAVKKPQHTLRETHES